MSGKGACIGITYESIARKGSSNDRSSLGYNDKSWLLWARDDVVVMHNSIKIKYPIELECISIVRVILCPSTRLI